MLYRMNQRSPLVFVDWLERKNASLSSVVLCDSYVWGKEIIAPWKIPESRLRICPIGLDLDRIDRAKKIPLPVDGPYVLFAGRLTLAKGPQILAAAAPAIHDRFPSVKFVFAGADTKEVGNEAISEMIRRSVSPDVSESFVFLGFIKSWDMLVSLYRNASVCVKADVMGNHSFDAMGQMACGKVLVCTKTEGNTDMIEHGSNGYLFDRDNPSQLSEIINTLLGDSDLTELVGRRARATIERRFTSMHCAEATLKYYEEALSMSAHRDKC
jgi:glycosyltransferase involved in cell wall biosynthesis